MYNQKPLSGDLLDYGDWSTDGLVGFWFMNEGSGNKVFDLSGNGFNSPAFSSSVTWASGPFGSVLDFTNTGAGVPINNSSLLKPGTGDMTWIIWLDMDADNGRDDFLSDRPLGALGTQEGFVIGASGGTPNGRVAILLEASDGSAKEYQKNSAYTVAEGWFQLAVTWNNSADELLIYKNGIDLTSTWTKSTDQNLSSKSISNNSNFIIGARPSGDREIDGRISQVLVYNSVKSASEIALLYQNPFRMIRTKRRRIITEEPSIVTAKVPWHLFFNKVA